jgi:glycyl-tRNA synthetase alpha subunit
LLDARGAISTTERAALIGRVRQIACKVAACYLDQTSSDGSSIGNENEESE